MLTGKERIAAYRMQRSRGGYGKRTYTKGRAWLGFLMPSFAGVMIFVIFPFADVVGRSFHTAITGQYVGTGNYETIFANSAFLMAVKNTFRFTAVGIPLLVVLGLAAALPLGKSKYVQTIKSLYLFPMAMPTATIVVVWRMIFAEKGFLNKYAALSASALGLDFPENVDFLGSGAAFYVLIGTYIWKNLGYTVVLWLAGILSVNGDILEAAAADGAGKWQSLWLVLLPNLKGSLYTIVVLSFLNSFKIYREAYLVAGAYPHDSIYLLQHLFNNWFVNLDLDKMAAAAVVCAVFLSVFILTLQRLWDKDV